jgi:S-adenosylmethionine:tRNA ribosyltransferase-isomerase
VEPFSYTLPQELIAQRPVYPPESARLLVIGDATNIRESTFENICDFLEPDSLLIFNDTKVFKARIKVQVSDIDQGEIFLIQCLGNGLWKAMARPMRIIKKLKSLKVITSKSVDVFLEIIDSSNQDFLTITFSPTIQSPDSKLLEEIGLMPIPPYIREGKSDFHDDVDYQPVQAHHTGSVASPTASLHFSEKLFCKIKNQGHDIDYITLHLGAASFLPLQRTPPPEQICVSKELFDKITQHKKDGKKIVAIGTTSCRALESIAISKTFDTFINTDLVIYPGHDFKLVDLLVTNFHQPGTSHLLLVEAFIGREKLNKLYTYAVSNTCRMLSYGDGCLVRKSV